MKKLFLIYNAGTGAFITLIEDFATVEKSKEAKAKANTVQAVHLTEELTEKIAEAKKAKKDIWIQDQEPIQNEGLVLIRDGVFMFDKADLSA